MLSGNSNAVWLRAVIGMLFILIMENIENNINFPSLTKNIYMKGLGFATALGLLLARTIRRLNVG